nr:SgcJ/EcaC family oxidoreductase [Micrococcus sp. JXJ CY 30]
MSPADPTADVAARPAGPAAVAEAFAAAWNAADADALADLFAEDADFVNVVGVWWTRRRQIRVNHALGFRWMFAASRLVLGQVRVRELGDVAVVHAPWTMTGADRARRRRGRRAHRRPAARGAPHRGRGVGGGGRAEHGLRARGADPPGRRRRAGRGALPPVGVDRSRRRPRRPGGLLSGGGLTPPSAAAPGTADGRGATEWSPPAFPPQPRLFSRTQSSSTRSPPTTNCRAPIVAKPRRS